jgi:hypothetical protein
VTNEELIQYYINLLIIQYRGKEKAEGTISAVISSIMLYEIIRAIEAGYNIDPDQGNTAIGEQLDVVAKYVGAERIVTGVDFSRTYFGFVNYSGDPITADAAGFLDYDQDEETYPDAQFLTYSTDQESIYTLTDGELLAIIILFTMINSGNASVKSIDDILYNYFENSVIFIDNLDMSMAFIFDISSQKLVQIALSENALPRPTGVSLGLSFVNDIDNIFGMLPYSSDASSAPHTQGFLNYSDDRFGSFLEY